MGFPRNLSAMNVVWIAKTKRTMATVTSHQPWKFVYSIVYFQVHINFLCIINYQLLIVENFTFSEFSSKSKMASNQMIYPGTRVVRGPNWCWEDQDGGEGSVGTIVENVKRTGPVGTTMVFFDNLFLP